MIDNRFDGVFVYCYYKIRFLNFNKLYISVCIVNVFGELIYIWVIIICWEYLFLLDFFVFDSNLCKVGIFLFLIVWIMLWFFIIVLKGNNFLYNVIYWKVNIVMFLYICVMFWWFYIIDRNLYMIFRLFL